jgi:hypothetical protein
VRVLALRDELVGRDFDDPGTWWPELPGAVGGRDRTAGGTWCATDVPTGTTAMVLNRPDKPVADDGAPSRGVLPLLALRHGAGWPSAVDLSGMASFALVLVSPEQLTLWVHDGEQLLREELEPGTRMVTSGRAEDGKAVRYLPTFTEGRFPEGWLDVLRASEPRPDPAELVVRGEHDGRVFATVFGQLFTSRPRHLELSWSRRPYGDGEWTSAFW